jgi:hypothetical protein
MTSVFPHRHAAHCESGTVATLLRSRGLDLSEPMVFGIAGGLYFIHVPFAKLGGFPLTAHRIMPRAIIKNLTKRLGIPMRYERFRDPEKGMRRLDELLASGVPVGMQANIFWLSYFPTDMRFQYNGHNMVAYGKQGDDYQISDPVGETVATCPADDLRRARFSRGGPFPPKGLLYYPESVPTHPNLAPAAIEATRKVCKDMLDTPIPFIGVRGIRYLANRLEHWPEKLGDKLARANVGHVIRMQEEIGTGGAGFRFLYAAFLQEAADVVARPALKDISRQLTEVGDRWREFAVLGAQLCKNKETGPLVYRRLADLLRQCADGEQRVFGELRRAIA